METESTQLRQFSHPLFFPSFFFLLLPFLSHPSHTALYLRGKFHCAVPSLSSFSYPSAIPPFVAPGPVEQNSGELKCVSKAVGGASCFGTRKKKKEAAHRRRFSTTLPAPQGTRLQVRAYGERYLPPDRGKGWRGAV